MKKTGNQKGFTLIEILVATAVSGILLAGVVLAIFQTVGVTAHSSTQITALEDIKIVARRITTDVKMAQDRPPDYPLNLEDGAPPVNNLSLYWESWYDDEGQLSPEGHRCVYTLLPEGKVQREYWKIGDSSHDITTFGKYISNIEFSRHDVHRADGTVVPVVITSITSSLEGNPETAERQTYHTSLLPTQDPVQ